MKRSLGLGLSMGFAMLSVIASGHDGQRSAYTPTPFSVGGKTIVPMDIQHIELVLNFDVAAKTAKGHAWINFNQRDAGRAMLDLVPNPTAVVLDGANLGADGLPTENAPQNASQVRVIANETAPGPHTLEIEYDLPSSKVTFNSTGVRIGFFMDDLDTDRGFLEQYAPSNMEFDAFEMDATVNLTGTTTAHQLFTNGRLTTFAVNQWKISFPSYFTTSSFYLHLTNANYAVEQFTYQGLEAPIPMTVYAESASSAKSAMNEAKEVMEELEGIFGPYAHSSFTAYITPGGGGMEHCGATMTSGWALGHEMTHSWFARGVMPANGNAGWIDEAVASWRDNGFPRGDTPSGSSTNLASFAEYRRRTPMAAYSKGADFISDLDYVFRDQGGMKDMLKRLFATHKRTTLSTPEFASFLERESNASLGAYFDKLVYGKSRDEGRFSEPHSRVNRTPVSRHPRPYTAEELARYR